MTLAEVKHVNRSEGYDGWGEISVGCGPACLGREPVWTPHVATQ